MHPPRDALKLDTFSHDAAHAYAVYRSVAIYMWRGAVQGYHPAQAQERWAQLRVTQVRFGVLVVVLPSAPPPPQDLRLAVTQAYLPFAKNICGVGTVIEDQGVRGAAAAMVMTAMMLMSKPPYAYRNGTKVEPMAAWLSQLLPNGPSGSDIADAVEHVRTSYLAECESFYHEAPPRPSGWRSLLPR